ncbi:MAG: type II CRISPR-associated endonuclease Cas1 [Sulfobacillus sp.]
MKRIVSIDHPGRLSCSHRQLIVEGEGSSRLEVPLEDLGALILDHVAVTHTQPLLVACAEFNVAVVLCDAKHQPCALVTPLSGSSLHTRTLAYQVALSQALRGRLWRTMVKAKIAEQARVLKAVTGSDDSLSAYADRVRSGDPDNIEAQAARVYWVRLFGPRFRRDQNAPGINSLLNYGYAVLRAAVARSIVGAGLHPALGFHHHNQYDSFCLADDMMEPLRPAVDQRVFALSSSHQDGDLELSSSSKRALLGLFESTATIGGDQRLPLMESLQRYAASVRGVMAGERRSVEVPRI